MHIIAHPTYLVIKKQGVPSVGRTIGGTCLLHSEVVGSKAGIVDVEDQPGVVGGGVKHLERVSHTQRKRFVCIYCNWAPQCFHNKFFLIL